MKNIEKYIDHTLLKPDATEAAIGKVCAEAIEHGFKSVCVNPARIAFVAKQLEGTGVLPCCVVGFPLGATFSKVKAFEAETAIANGAKEVDMVINIGAAKDGNWNLVESDIAAVVDAAKGQAVVKVIIETCLLTEEEKIKACELVTKAGAEYIKTSTGFSTAGATFEDVKLMREHVGKDVKVKAAGGISSFADAEKFIELGADRLGTSRLVKIMKREG